MSNSMGLIYRQFTPACAGLNFTVSTPSNVYTAARKAIKPSLENLKLKPNNPNGVGASRFHQQLGRFGFHWLDFLLPEYTPIASDYPTEHALVELGVLKETEIATQEEWRSILAEDAEKHDIYLLVGLEAMLDRDKFRLSGIPSKCFPLELKVHECVMTNAPVCQYLRYRSHVLV